MLSVLSVLSALSTRSTLSNYGAPPPSLPLALEHTSAKPSLGCCRLGDPGTGYITAL